jgi:hypothetical protein
MSESYAKNCRHAGAVVLLGGWLLMSPPIKDRDTWSFDSDAPITKWQQDEAFDHADSCEAALRSRSKLAFDEYMKHIKRTFNENMWHYSNTRRCVPADYIYPPPAVPTPK